VVLEDQNYQLEKELEKFLASEEYLKSKNKRPRSFSPLR
jgi:hypothetical protein